MKKRYETLDFLKGLAILGMITFHALFDLENIFGVDLPFFNASVTLYLQTIVGIIFIIVSGALSRNSNNLLKRGAFIFGLGMVLTIISFIFFPEAIIVFGVLHFLGLAMVITCLIKPLLNIVPNILGFIVCILLFYITRFIYFGYILIPFIGMKILPISLYKTDFLFFLGFPDKGFISSDYYPIFPWYFIFLAGYFGLKIIAKNEEKPFLHFKFLPVNFLGRHSLLVYIVHQPIIYIICLVLFDKIW